MAEVKQLPSGQQQPQNSDLFNLEDVKDLLWEKDVTIMMLKKEIVKLQQALQKNN